MFGHSARLDKAIDILLSACECGKFGHVDAAAQCMFGWCCRYVWLVGYVCMVGRLCIVGRVYMYVLWVGYVCMVGT